MVIFVIKKNNLDFVILTQLSNFIIALKLMELNVIISKHYGHLPMMEYLLVL